MKTLTQTTFLGLLLAFCSARADSPRFVTVTVNPTLTSTNYPSEFNWTATNTVQIAEGEAGEVVSVVGNQHAFASIAKNDVTLLTASAASPTGATVAGPATFILHMAYPTTSYQPKQDGALMTVKISPLAFSPQKPVTVAPGMGNVQITLESSTNLLTWADATNGIYSDDLKFFRVKLTKLNP